MTHPRSFMRRTVLLASLAWLGSLAGCGAGSAGEPEASDTKAYADTLAYCGSQEPTGADAQAGSWTLSSPSHSGSPVYDVSAIVSPAGASAPTMPVRLQVDIHDYRGLTGNFLLPGYVNPLWKMGVNLAPVLPARSAACVVSLAKLPIMPTLSGVHVVGNISWRSKWSSAMSFAGLSGQVIDGFEFVGDFAPANASAYFFVPKSWAANAQSLSICYLAPSEGSWDCSTPSVTDAGAEWGVSRAGAKPGVYVVTASAGG